MEHLREDQGMKSIYFSYNRGLLHFLYLLRDDHHDPAEGLLGRAPFMMVMMVTMTTFNGSHLPTIKPSRQ